MKCKNKPTFQGRKKHMHKSFLFNFVSTPREQKRTTYTMHYLSSEYLHLLVPLSSESKKMLLDPLSHESKKMLEKLLDNLN